MSEWASQPIEAKLRPVLLAAHHLRIREGSSIGKRVQRFLEA